MVDGRLSHEGSLEHGNSLRSNDVQVQRAGGEKSRDLDFPAKIKIDVAILNNEQSIKVNQPFLAYITRGKGFANGEPIEDGNLVRGESLHFSATENVQIIVAHASTNH